MIALTTAQIIAIVIFVVVMALIISEKVHRTTAALAGAVALILSGVLTFDNGVEHIDFGTLGVLVGMMIFVAVVKNSGMLRVPGNQSCQTGKGQSLDNHGVVCYLTNHRCSFRIPGQRHHRFAYRPRYLHRLQDVGDQPHSRSS